MDWNAVLPNLIASLIALIGGIPAGLWLDRLINQAKSRNQSQLQIDTINQELTTNIAILANISKVLGDGYEKQSLPYPNVLLTAWSTAKQQGFIQTYKHPKQLTMIVAIYRDLEEIEIRVEQLWQLAASGMSIVGDTRPQYSLIANRARDLADKVNPKIANLFLSLGVVKKPQM